MTPKEMFYFMGKCLVLEEYPENRQKIIDIIRTGSFPWEQFVQTASHHLILPALYVKFRNASLLHYLPKTLVPYLREIYEMNKHRNLLIMKQVNWMISIFSWSDIHPVFLKGAGALLDGLYDDPGERVMNDIDCMVSDHDFEAAVDLLKKVDYSNPSFTPESLPLMHHYPSLFKAHEPALIEIHKFPVGVRQLKYLDVEEMKSRLFSLERSPKTYTPEVSDRVIINFIHSQLKDHGQYYARVSLRNIYEFYRLSLANDISDIELKGKYAKRLFNNYMALAAKICAPASRFPHYKSLSAKRYIARVERYKTSRFSYRSGKLIRSVIKLFRNYMFITVKALYREDYRNHLRVRLFNPAWYKRHLSIVLGKPGGF